MQIVEVTSYGNKTGSNTNFLLSGKEMRPKLLETLDFFIPLRKFSEKQSCMVDDEIQGALMRAQGPAAFGKL